MASPHNACFHHSTSELEMNLAIRLRMLNFVYPMLMSKVYRLDCLIKSKQWECLTSFLVSHRKDKTLCTFEIRFTQVPSAGLYINDDPDGIPASNGPFLSIKHGPLLKSHRSLNELNQSNISNSWFVTCHLIAVNYARRLTSRSIQGMEEIQE